MARRSGGAAGEDRSAAGTAVEGAGTGAPDGTVAEEGRPSAGAAASRRDDDGTGAAGRRGTGFWSVAQSVGAAMIGVQSHRNRERDFTRGKPLHFVIGGIVGTLLFVLAVWLLVRYVMATAG